MLRDVIAGSGLQLFAEVGLVIFLVTFLAVAVRVLSRRRGHYDQVARIPLHDGDVEAGGGDASANDASAAPRSIG
jgi:cbb3-type cytochrome oxidase subunit 3